MLSSSHRLAPTHQPFGQSRDALIASQENELIGNETHTFRHARIEFTFPAFLGFLISLVSFFIKKVDFCGGKGNSNRMTHL